MDKGSIELFNAHGPFDHGVWKIASPQSGDLRFGDDSLFQSRADRMVKVIVEKLRRTYTTEQLAAASILDVGCYDGWILTNIASQIRFKRSVGIDPRRKNIEKGKYARAVCGIADDSEFVEGSYEDLDALFPNDSFDIVLCLGMIHHVPSAYGAIRAVAAKCLDLLIVDSMVIPELQGDRASIEPMVNTRDVIYRGRPSDWAIAAFKYESPYFDGSTDRYQLVSIPQEALLRMSLVVSGFEAADCLMTERDFYPESSQQVRGVREVMLSSRRIRAERVVERAWIDSAVAYERLYCTVVLSAFALRRLVERFDLRESGIETTTLGLDALVLPEGLADALDAAIDHPGSMSAGERAKLVQHGIDEQQVEILATVPRAPRDKTLLDLGKRALAMDQLEVARRLFQSITQRVNADWRSFYRACYLLWITEGLLGDEGEAGHYKQLLEMSNDRFPLDEMPQGLVLP